MLTAGIVGSYLCPTEVLNHENLNSHGLASIQFIFSCGCSVFCWSCGQTRGSQSQNGVTARCWQDLDKIWLRCRRDLRAEMAGNCSSDPEKSQVPVWDKQDFSEYLRGLLILFYLHFSVKQQKCVHFHHRRNVNITHDDVNLHPASYTELFWIIISIITHRNFFSCEKSFVDRVVVMPVSSLSIAQSGICKMWEMSSYFWGVRQLVFGVLFMFL